MPNNCCIFAPIISCVRVGRAFASKTKRMKKAYLYLLLALVAAPLLLGSCKAEEEEIVYTDQCYISSFTLGSLKRTHFTKDSEGLDSVYYTVFAGNSFPMTINQRTDTIQNLDSLPLHTRVDAVLATVSYTSGLVWRKADLTGVEDTTWTVYDSKDSIDFSAPLHFMAVASNGVNLRQYVVKVNVHKQRGDTTVWSRQAEIPNANITTQRRAVALDGKLIVLSNNASGQLQCAVRSTQSGAQWATHNTTLTNALPATLQKQGRTLLMSLQDGTVVQSTDGIVWTATAYPQADGLQLVAAGDNRLYALCNGTLVSSDGGEWLVEELDDEASNLPDSEIQGNSYTMSNGQQRLLLVGQRGGKTVIWAKAWDAGEEQQESWMYYTPNGYNRYALPALASLNVLPYDGGFIALGGAARNGGQKAMQRALRTPDHGVTWQPYAGGDLNIDPAVQEAAQTARHIAVAVDEDNFLWVMLDNQVWRGRINRLGFLRQDR